MMRQPLPRKMLLAVASFGLVSALALQGQPAGREATLHAPGLPLFEEQMEAAKWRYSSRDYETFWRRSLREAAARSGAELDQVLTRFAEASRDGYVDGCVLKAVDLRTVPYSVAVADALCDLGSTGRRTLFSALLGSPESYMEEVRVGATVTWAPSWSEVAIRALGEADSALVSKIRRGLEIRRGGAISAGERLALDRVEFVLLPVAVARSRPDGTALKDLLGKAVSQPCETRFGCELREELVSHASYWLSEMGSRSTGALERALAAEEERQLQSRSRRIGRTAHGLGDEGDSLGVLAVKGALFRLDPISAGGRSWSRRFPETLLLR